MDGGRPRPGRSPYRRPDPDRTADIAARQSFAVQQHVAQLGQERTVGFQPVDVVQFLGGQPAQRVMFGAGRLTLGQRAERHPQLQLATAVAAPDRTGQPRLHPDDANQFLANLPSQSILRSLAGIDLAARKLPPSGFGSRVTAPGGQHAPMPDDRRTHHPDHPPTLSSRARATQADASDVEIAGQVAGASRAADGTRGRFFSYRGWNEGTVLFVPPVRVGCGRQEERFRAVSAVQPATVDRKEPSPADRGRLRNGTKRTVPAYRKWNEKNRPRVPGQTRYAASSSSSRPPANWERYRRW